MASKTAERILLVSLELFNTQGEANVTSVDIANDLDMSPGNLYYHFKGKEDITAALFSMYQERMKKILFSPNEEQLLIKEFFYFLYMIVETIHLFRFLNRNPSDLINKYPYIARGFKQLLKTKERGIEQILNHFAEQGDLHIKPPQLAHLTELISMILTQGLNYHGMKGADLNDSDITYHLLLKIFFVLAPYLAISESQKHQLQTALINCSLDAA